MWYLEARGDARAALPIARNLHQQWDRRYGPDDHYTLFAASNLADAFKDLGEYRHALDLYEDTLARRRRVLGDDHPETLRSANNLANGMRELGEYARARELDEDTFARYRRVLGDDHPETLRSANNLANGMRELGEYARARELDEDTFARYRRVLGDDHPATLRSANNLANDMRELGEYARARELDEDTFARYRRVLGDDHPATLRSANNLANDMRELGEYARARELDEDTFARYRRVLGDDHPATLTTRNNLAHWTGEAGDAVGAREQLAALLPDRVRVLGPDHPDTLTTRNNLAHWTGEAGDAVGAREQLAALLPDRVRVLGPDHPDTLTTRNNLANWTGEAGDVVGAREQLAALLPDRVRVLGPDHPDTLTTRNNLAHWTGEAGDAVGAREQLAALLPDRVRVLGPDHPDTLTTRNNLANWTGEAGDAVGAREQLAALLPDRVRVLGPDHPDTLTTRNNLAHWTGEAGDDEPKKEPGGKADLPVSGATATRSRWSPRKVKQRASHAHLLLDMSRSPAPPMRSARARLDAIIVPASRPASFLQPTIELAARLDVLLVVLCNQETKAETVAKRVTRTSAARSLIVPIPDSWTHPAFPTRTSAAVFQQANANRKSDLSTKRNLGLLLARLHGWNKIVFLDDDITRLSTKNMARLAAQLDEHSVAGMVVGPNNSVVCHARMLAGFAQGLFLTGAVLGVHCNDLPMSFFPDIYNGDWFFFAKEAAARALPQVGKATQIEFDPFASPYQARQEEFGDLLAEGLYALIGEAEPSMPFQEQLRRATKTYWSYFIEARHQVITETQAALHRLIDHEIYTDHALAAVNSLAVAESQLDMITPDLCVDFIDAWSADLYDWQRFTNSINRLGSTREAMVFLELKTWRLAPAS